MNVKEGQIWRDNYGLRFHEDAFVATEHTRYVRVLSVGVDDALIQRCESNGDPVPRSPSRSTKLKRFNGTKSGFTLVKDVS